MQSCRLSLPLPEFLITKPFISLQEEQSSVFTTDPATWSNMTSIHFNNQTHICLDRINKVICTHCLEMICIAWSFMNMEQMETYRTLAVLSRSPALHRRCFSRMLSNCWERRVYTAYLIISIKTAKLTWTKLDNLFGFLGFVCCCFGQIAWTWHGDYSMRESDSSGPHFNRFQDWIQGSWTLGKLCGLNLRNSH